MLITDRWAGLIWDFYLQDRTAQSIITALDALFKILEKRYQITPKVVECDNEITKVKPQVRVWLEGKAIKIEPSAPQTQSQNGAAEHSGGVIKEKGRAMRASSKFPSFLWPEITRAAVYLYNRTPKYIYNWKSPYERFFTRLAHREGVVIDCQKPSQSHLRAYGCKAFAMTSSAQKKKQRLKRFDPRAWIGFLIGYSSSNIYRVWIPAQNKVISTRDVIFNEDEFFDGNVQSLKDDLLHISMEELAELVKKTALPEQEEEDLPETTIEDEPEFMIPSGLDMTIETIEDEEAQDEEAQDECSQHECPQYEPYPTPAPTPPAALLAHSIRQAPEAEFIPDPSDKTVWQAAFCAGRLSVPIGQIKGKIVDKAQVQRLMEKGIRIKRSMLPPAPKWHHELKSHPFGALFEQAELSHLQSHKEMRSWTEIDKEDPPRQRQADP